ncbi:dynamin family protein [Bacillus pinisoli]|uniref:dynamin family protein n=1 Tax=Bacillus pinisoli TaxID=2901866 RepID=UPI001FF6ED5C|nr:dynamin family protein [Bacillus pinisoli]
MSQKLESAPILTEEDLLTNLTGLFLEMEKSGNTELSKKMKQLVKKASENEYSIGFCGHFSAGKSSMINEIVGHEVVPASPIPTSANLVKIRSGEEVARVYLFTGEVVEFPAPYDIDEIKQFCMDGEAVEWVEIGTNSSFIPSEVTVLDTPGIDSVDDAHRISTESALHLADLVFYMMDYNHVQSEVSFHFTKKLQEMNKPLYLIINQVDKHQESELSFNDFQAGVLQAFHDWGVYPDGIFYTSLRDKELPINQLSEVKQLLSDVWATKDQSFMKGIADSAKNLILDHVEWLEERGNDEALKWEEKLSGLSSAERQDLSKKMSGIEQEIQGLVTSVDEAKHEFQKDLTKLLDNAYIMPFQTRELATQFLESEQPEFKVGLIFSKQKTEKERDDRLQAFYKDLMEKVSAQIDWHVKDLLTKFCKKRGLHESLLNDVYQLNVSIQPTDLRNLVKRGAKVTGDAILNFTNDVGSECKRKYRLEATQILEKWLKELSLQNNEQMNELQNELTKYGEYKEAINKLQKRTNELNTVRQLLMTILENGPETNITEEKQRLLQSLQYKKGTVEELKKIVAKVEAGQSNEMMSRDTDEVKHELNAPQMVDKINAVTESVQQIKGLQTVVQQLKEKANRLSNQSFSVALFGAFSAGKSSFANALMGTKLLPVSPNPTTATINKIKPVTEEFPHGTVRVQLKSIKQLETDLAFSLKFFHHSFTNLSEAIEQIPSVLKIKDIDPRQKPHYSFLQAVLKGYQHMNDDFGKLKFVDLEEFKEYVANEEKSCFVEWIEVYYDCELTNQGITLVDTPGADSINARHTGVAFEYIKNADAILFVTYYNHAFSKADREFLIQLGRVKDAFELDKMFFMINAADLASSLEELEVVKNYVGTQLLSYGIRNPRLFPVSSLLALKEKEGQSIQELTMMNDSGIGYFENEFSHFIQHELTELTISSAQLDLKRVHQVVKEYIEMASIGNDEKEARMNRLQEQQTQILTQLKQAEVDSAKKAIEMELKELLYYVKQRVFLRFTDIFNESFHPSVLSDDHKNIKLALEGCLDELLEFIGFDLLQELRATSVRVEGFLKNQLQFIHQKANQKISHIHNGLELTFITPDKVEVPVLTSVVETFDRRQLSKPLASFKNAKAFFEKNGKKNLRDELETLLQDPVSHYLNSMQSELTTYYLEIFMNQTLKWEQHSAQEVNHYFEGLYDVMSDKMDIDKLKSIESQVSHMI